MEDFSAAMEQLGKLLVGAFKVHESYGFWITIVASLALVACGVWMKLGKGFAPIVPAAGEPSTELVSAPAPSQPSLKSVSTPPNVISAVLILAAVVLLAIGIFRDPGKSSAIADSKNETASATTRAADPLAKAQSDYYTLFTGTTADDALRKSYLDANNRVAWVNYPKFCAALAAVDNRIIANERNIYWPPEVSAQASAYIKELSLQAKVAQSCAQLPGTSEAQSANSDLIMSINPDRYLSQLKVALQIP
jgi:hypothetical protein